MSSAGTGYFFIQLKSGQNSAFQYTGNLVASSGTHHLGNTSLGMGWSLRTASMFAIASSAIVRMAWTVAVPMCGVMMTLFRFNKG